MLETLVRELLRARLMSLLAPPLVLVRMEMSTSASALRNGLREDEEKFLLEHLKPGDPFLSLHWDPENSL